MSKNTKKTILQTIGGISASSILVGAITMQPAGSLKQAVNQYNESTAVSAIQNSALAQAGAISNPYIAKSLAGNSSSNTHSSINPYYTSPDYQTHAYNADGTEYDMVSQDQKVSREITLSNGETYEEVYGYEDGQGNYLDILPTNASIGIENTPGTGDASGYAYEEYTSLPDQTVEFLELPDGAIEGENTAGPNGPSSVYDIATNSWVNVTGDNTGGTGDGSGGTYTPTKDVVIDAGGWWPEVDQFQPWHGDEGYWDVESILGYADWLWDTNIGDPDDTIIISADLRAQATWANIIRAAIGSVPSTYTKSDMRKILARIQVDYNAYEGHTLQYMGFFIRFVHFAGFTNQIAYFDIRENEGFDYIGDGVDFRDTIISSTTPYPLGDGSGTYYDGARDGEQTYVGPVFDSGNPHGGGPLSIYLPKEQYVPIDFEEGFNPWHGDEGIWDVESILGYADWLWDTNIGDPDDTIIISADLRGQSTWANLIRAAIGSVPSTYNKSDIRKILARIQVDYNAYEGHTLQYMGFFIRFVHFAAFTNQIEYFHIREEDGFDYVGDSVDFRGKTISSQRPYPFGNGSGVAYNATDYDFNNILDNVIYDEDYKIYPSLPINAEKQATLNERQSDGVGDGTGKLYQQGKMIAVFSDIIDPRVFSSNDTTIIDGTLNVANVGDGSGLIYNRALYYYDEDGNILDSLPSDQFLYSENGGNLFNSAETSSFSTNQDRYEGVGLSGLIEWISNNSDTLSISNDFTNFNIDFVVTETDTKQKRLIIALQAAIQLLSGVSDQTSLNNALSNFGNIVNISQSEMDSISANANSISSASITHGVKEGYEEVIQVFNSTFKIYGTESTTTAVADFLDSTDLAQFFALSSTMNVFEIETSAGISYVYNRTKVNNIAGDILATASISNLIDLENALLPEDLMKTHYEIDSWSFAADNNVTITDVRYTDFDYDKTDMTIEIILAVGDTTRIITESIRYQYSYMDKIMNTLAIDELVGSTTMLAEQPLLTTAEYSVGTETEVNANTVSFALQDSFDAKFPETVNLLSVVQLSPPTEDQTDVQYQFTIEYEGHERTFNQFFTFDKTRSQKYIENAISSITNVNATTSIFDKTILDLTSRTETFLPFDTFLENDGNTAARMSFSNIQLVGGGDIDRNAVSMDFTVDIAMGSYTLTNHPLTLDLNHSVNQELLNNLTEDEIVATAPGIVTIVDEFDPTTPEYENSAWWTIQSSWLQMIDIAGIAFVGNFNKIDERHFSVDLEVTIDTGISKVINVTQKVGFNLNFAPVLDESTTGISDPDTLEAFREYMLRFNEQSSVFYVGSFDHAFIATTSLESELLQAWEGTVSTLAGDAIIRSVSITDINAVTKYDRDVSFRITLEDSFGNTRVFDKIYQFAISPVAYQFRDATASMISTTQNLAGQLSDTVMTQMQNITDYQWLEEHLNLLDTVRVVSVTNTGYTAHIVFEFGYSGHLGDDSKQVSINYVFDRRGDKDLALSMFGLGYTEAELSAYYDINDVDANNNNWKNVEQLVLDELVKFAAQSTLRDDMEDEMKATHASIDSNVWGSTVELQTAIEDITTTNIMALLQAEILAGGTTRTTFITNEWTELRNEKMEEMILSDLASNWKLNSSTDALNEVLKYNSTFDIKDNYLANVVTVVENANFVIDISLEIAHATIIPYVLDTTLQGVNQSTELDYYNAINLATNNAFVAEYANNLSGTWTNINEFIKLIADATSQIIIDAQVNVSNTIISTTHYNDRGINELVKDLTLFTDEEIKIVGYDVENAGVLDRDSSSFNIEVFMTFGSIVNQRHVFTLQLDKSVNQAILDAIQTSDIELKDFLVPGMDLASTLEADTDRWQTWDKFGLSASHVLTSDMLTGSVDTSSFTIVGDVNTSPSFTLDFDLTIGGTTKTYTTQMRIGMDIIFDLKDVDASDTELLEFLRGYDVAARIDYQGTWLHPYEMLDALDADESALDNVLDMYEGLVASNITINDIYVQNRDGISEFAKTVTLKIVAEDKNGFVKVFDKVITFGTTAAEWAFNEFSEANVVLVDTNITNGMLTDGVKENILGQKSGYVISNHRNPIHIDDPIVTHNGKTATVSWRVWYSDGQPGGEANSKIVEIDYVFASRGSKDEALANYGLQYSDTDINVDWNTVDAFGNDWTNVEQNVLDELVRGLAETKIRDDLEADILGDASEYATNVWTSAGELQTDIIALTDINTISTLAQNIVAGSTTRGAFLANLKLNMQRDKIEENILTTMQARWNQSSVENLLNLISQLNSIIDVKDYYESDMHNVIKTASYATDISRQMELDTIRNNVSAIITVGLDPSDSRYTIYNNVMNAKLDATYDAAQAGTFADIATLINIVADSISQEAINDLLATISSSIDGTVDKDTRVLADIYMNLSAFDQAGILHSNIDIVNGDPLSIDLQAVPLSVDLIWGSVSNNTVAITMNLNKTVAQAMIEAIQYDEIGLIDQRLASISADVVAADLTSDLFGLFSRHILGSDVFTLDIDTASFTPDPIEPRDFTMDVTITIGNETRTINILASVGFDIDLDWENIDLSDPNITDEEKDMFDFMSSYDFQKETEYFGLHANPWELRDEQHLLDQFSPSRNLKAAKGEFTNVVIKDPSSITKYDRSLWIIVTVMDKNGVTYDYEKEIVLSESYIESLTKNTNESHFDIVPTIQLTDMLTDATIAEMSLLSAYDVDAMLNEFDIVEILSLQQSGKTATATFRVSYDDGNGHTGSKILTKDFVFASRGDKDLSVTDFGLGYTDGELNIDWNTVDAFGNDWTNVEQDVLNQLVKGTAYDKVRGDVGVSITNDSTGYVANVFGSVNNLNDSILTFASNSELINLQDLITNNAKTRNEWLLETKTFLQTSNVERMILEALASEWKLINSETALAKAEDLQSGFDITSYYADIHNLVQSPTFDTDQTRQIGYDIFSSITRDLMDIFHSTVDTNRDVHYDNVHATFFEAKFDENITGSWTQLNEFEKLVSDSISRQFIDDEIAKITTSTTGYPTILGFVDKNTRMLNDVVKDFSVLETQYIDVSNIRLTSNGTTLNGDLDMEHIYAGISFGSVVVDDIVFTLDFDQSINYAIMEAISSTDIRMTEYRTSETTDKIDPDDILAWMFTPLASHIRQSDAIVVSLDASNPFMPLDIAEDPYLRRYTIGITLTLGAETRTYNVTEKLGQLIVFGVIDASRYVELEIIDDDDAVDFIAYNDSYPYVDSIKYVENFDHVLDVQSATEQDWLDALSPSLYVLGGGMSIAQVELKDAGTYTKFDKEFTFILTLQDQWGAQRVFEKTIILANSAVEYALLEASESTFNFTDHDNTQAILTDHVLQNILTDKSSYFIDSDISQYLDISSPIVEYKGKTATVGFQVSYDDGAGYADSRVIQIDIVFASRGSKDDAIANFGLGYDDIRLGINWNSVDSFANDWTNVEQDVLDNLVKAASQFEIRADINDDILAAAAEYISNVWEGQLELSADIEKDTTYALLAELQAEITNGTITRNEFVTNLVYLLKTTKIESLLLGNMATLWRLNDAMDAESRAVSVKSDFDIKDYYYSNMDGIIQSGSFVDTITYNTFEELYRSDIDTSMLSSATDADKPKVTEAIDNFINDKVREVFALNIWTNDSSIVSHTSHLISEQAINDAMTFVNSTVTGDIDRDTRNIKDVEIDWQELQDKGLYVSNVLLNGSTDGEFIDRDATVLPSSVSVTFGTIIDQPYLINVVINETLNQAILGALTSSSITLKNAKLYASIDHMLEKMGEDAAGTGSNTITNASYFESAVDFLDRDDADIAMDPNNTLVAQAGSTRIFNIGLIITAGAETRNLEIQVQVGESIDFSLPEFGEGGAFDFNPYFITTTTTYDNAYDLDKAGDDAINHIGIDGFLSASFITVNSITLGNNAGIDIFSRQFVATFELQDQRGNVRTFVDQPIVIPGGMNKAESIMDSASQTDIRLDDSTILNGQLTDDMLNVTLMDLSTYSFGNDIDLLNDLQVKEVTHIGKHATVTIIVGYNDGAGGEDHQEFTLNYEFAYRADVAWSLSYYGLDMTVDQLGISWTTDQEEGNVEQDVIDTIVLDALKDYLFAQYELDLQTFVDAGILTSQEVTDDLTAFLDAAKMDEVVTDGQSMQRDEVIAKYQLEITMLSVEKALDAISVSLLKANDWAEVSSAYPSLANALETSIEEAIANRTFDAADIESTLGTEFAIAIAPEVQAIAENGAPGVPAWLMQMIGDEKAGFLWMVHSTIEAQLSAGFNDAPKLSDETSHIHVNENSANGWFMDEISNLTSFANMDDYLIHLSTKIARLEIPAQISDEQLAIAWDSLKVNLTSQLQDIIDEGIFTAEDIDNYLEILLYVDNDHPQGFPDANFDAIFSPDKYFTDNRLAIIAEQLTHTADTLVEDAGFSSLDEMLAKVATYIEVNGNSLRIETNTANYTSSNTMNEYRDAHNHYTFILMDSVYVEAYAIYQNDATDNLVADFDGFMNSYISKMDVHLSGLEGIEYDDQDNLSTQAAFIAMRVNQIQNKPDIQAMVDKMINAIGLTESTIDDSPYKDLNKFTITEEELFDHLYAEALAQILEPGGVFDLVVDGLTNPPTSAQIESAKVILDDLMTQQYPIDNIELDITIKSAILFATLDDDYYATIVNKYDQLVEGQTPVWTPSATIDEARDQMAPIIERIFEQLINGTLDFDQALIEVDNSVDEIATALTWIKYEAAFISIFEQIKESDEHLARMTTQELEDYVVNKLSKPSLAYYIQEFADADKLNDTIPNTNDMLAHIEGIIDGAIDYAQELFDQLLTDIADASKTDVDGVQKNSSIMSDVETLYYKGALSYGGTATEIEALRASLGRYVFELIIEVTEKPDPEQNLNGWLIPFAAMITKTEDYSKISQIIQDKIDAGEEVDYENWGFENVADIMDALIDTTEEQETYNAATGKILMDKFIRSADSSSNAWSTTMWMGPVPLRMTYGNDGDIALMQTILMDREDPETIKSIGLSTHYNQNELALRLGMSDGTIVYIRYVEDADGNINVILQRLDEDSNWITSEMYREQNTNEEISSKYYQIFRDTNLGQFDGQQSEFEAGMITIFGESPIHVPLTNSDNQSTKVTIDHVWGDNPTVDSSTDTGNAEAARALVTKDDKGNTHIKMHMKDMKITNVANSMTATITAGGFTLMWLIWSFLGGFASISTLGFSTGVFALGRKSKKKVFTIKNPQYAGASTKSLIALKRAKKEVAKASKAYNKSRTSFDASFDAPEKERALQDMLDLRRNEFSKAEAIVFAEAEAVKYRKGFEHDVNNDKLLTNDGIERAARLPQILEQRTLMASQVSGGRFVQNVTQQEMVMKRNKPIKKTIKENLDPVVPEEERNVVFEQRTGPTLREIERTITAVKYLNTTALLPSIHNPGDGVDFSPFKDLGIKIISVTFKRAAIDKNNREQRLALVLEVGNRQFNKDVKVVYGRSINEYIIMNIDNYEVDISSLKRFNDTTDKGFSHNGICNLFKVQAPGAITQLVKGSLVIHDSKSYSGKLRITVGKLVTTIPFSAKL